MGRYLDLAAGAIVGLDTGSQCEKSELSEISPLERLIRRAHLAVVPDLSDPEDIRVWLDERAAMREDSGTMRVDADKLVFDELLWLWCAANPVEHAPGLCAACGTTLGPLCVEAFLGTEYLLQGGELAGVAAGKLLKECSVVRARLNRHTNCIGQGADSLA